LNTNQPYYNQLTDPIRESVQAYRRKKRWNIQINSKILPLGCVQPKLPLHFALPGCLRMTDRTRPDRG